jgi:flavin reductase (DIM6/NTAB) family NADH-FMN oxidoreductase RutF
MDIGFGDPRMKGFVTNVGLITSSGPHGDNIMACEWTYRISYSPSLLAVCIGRGKATSENILFSKEFGVNICSTQQNEVSSIAGRSSGKTTNKIGALKELGVEFNNGEEIDVLMVKESSIKAECNLIKVVDVGDHPILIGEVVKITTNEADPITYHKGKYWNVGENIPKPDSNRMEEINTTVQKHVKSS